MGQGPHNIFIQLNQTQACPKSIMKLAQTIKIGACIFMQKHKNTRLGVQIDPKKII